jgi:hypothetical protein
MRVKMARPRGRSTTTSSPSSLPSSALPTGEATLILPSADVELLGADELVVHGGAVLVLERHPGAEGHLLGRPLRRV